METRLAVVTDDRNELQAKTLDDEAEIDEIIRKQQSQTKLVLIIDINLVISLKIQFLGSNQ